MENPLLLNLNDKVDSEVFSDVTFVLDDGCVVKAHRVILCAGCPYFSKMFSSGLCESKSSENDSPIRIEGVSKEIFFQLLQAIYTGKSQGLSLTNILEVLELSCLYMIPYLTSQCCEYLTQQIDNKNCLMILELTKTRYQVDRSEVWLSLREAVAQYLRKCANLKQLILKAQDADFDDFTMNFLLEIARLRLNTSELLEIGDTVIQWAKSSIPEILADEYKPRSSNQDEGLCFEWQLTHDMLQTLSKPSLREFDSPPFGTTRDWCLKVQSTNQGNVGIYLMSPGGSDWKFRASWNLSIEIDGIEQTWPYKNHIFSKRYLYGFGIPKASTKDEFSSLSPQSNVFVRLRDLKINSVFGFCCKLAVINFESFYKNGFIDQIESELLVNILSSHFLQVPNEAVVLRSVIQWDKHHKDDEALLKLLSQVRVEYIEFSQFIELIKGSKRLRDCSETKRLVAHAIESVHQGVQRRRRHTYSDMELPVYNSTSVVDAIFSQF